jgi:hypothetical protein
LWISFFPSSLREEGGRETKGKQAERKKKKKYEKRHNNVVREREV